MAQSAVIIDVDGVLNSFQNRKFYAKFILEVGRSLRHLNPSRKNIIQSIKDFKKNRPNPNGLFRYLRGLCRTEQQFNKLTHGLVKNLNFNHIPQDKRLTERLQQIPQDGSLVIVRTDGLKEVAEGVLKSLTGGKLDGRNVVISDIRDNNYQDKTIEKSWPEFFEKYDIDPKNSILLDDSRHNIKTASKFGVHGCLVSRKDPLLNFMNEIVASRVKEKLQKKNGVENLVPATASVSQSFVNVRPSGSRDI